MKSSPSSVPPSISISKAILVGQLVVNGPATLIMIISAVTGLIVSGAVRSSNLWLLFLLGGFVFAWVWWAVAVPRWRHWAIQQGCDPGELHKMAVATFLEWPKGSVFEKTEIKSHSFSEQAANETPSGFPSTEDSASLEQIASAAVAVPNAKSFPIRAAALLLDSIVLMAVIYPIEFIVVFLVHMGITAYCKTVGLSYIPARMSLPLIYGLILALDFIYLVVFTWWVGGTPGKMILKMRVVTKTGERVGLRASLSRSATIMLDSMCLGIVAFFTMKPPFYQRSGDKLANTIVVSTNDPTIKQMYSKKRYLASAGVFVISTIIAMTILAASTIGPIVPLVKTPANQINLQLSELPSSVSLTRDTRTIPATSKTMIDENNRKFNAPDKRIISEVMVFSSLVNFTSASIKTANENAIKDMAGDLPVIIQPEIEYTSDNKGLIESFLVSDKNVKGYSLYLTRKNIVIHMVLYGETDTVQLEDIQKLENLILSRIP